MSGPDRRSWVRQTIAGLIMLPLSALPFVFYFQNTQEGGILWAKVETSVLPPRVEGLSEAQLRWAEENAPAYEGSVALLAYHGLGNGTDDEGGYTISPERFAEQLATLRAAGMQDVTAAEVALAFAGMKPLPPNAVMISFDDGRNDAMLYADPILESLRMRATMFTITGAAAQPGVYYVPWKDLRDYAGSGRWDIQSHTTRLHHEHFGEDGRKLPALTSLRPGESLAEYRARVREDLLGASARIEREVGTPPVAFAYPFGAYGGRYDDRKNHAEVEGIVRKAVESAYTISFNQDDQHTWRLASCGDDPHRLRRLNVGDWSGRELLSRIRAGARAEVATPDCTDVHITGRGAERIAALEPRARVAVERTAAELGAEERPVPDEVLASLPPLAADAGDALTSCDARAGLCVGVTVPATIDVPGLTDHLLRIARGVAVASGESFVPQPASQSSGSATRPRSSGPPSGGGGSQPPSGGGGTQPPSDGGGTQPPPSGGGTTQPPSSGGSQPPSSGGGTEPPTNSGPPSKGKGNGPPSDPGGGNGKNPKK